jgi:hypothetical protein
LHDARKSHRDRSKERDMGNRDYGNDRGRRDEVFIRESGPGQVPGQRWSGGYGGDRDRYHPGPAYGAPIGRGFTGNDFGGRPERHFGNIVDRGGRMGPGGEETTGRGYWGWESDRAGGVNVGPMGGREGYEGRDFATGAHDRAAPYRTEEERGPHWGKGPKGYKRNDERTREDVCEAIAYQGDIDATDVEVKVQDGVVTLTGTVALRQDKRGLERLVERVRGVHEVHNELRLAREQKREQPREQASAPMPPTSSGGGPPSSKHN